MSLCQELEFTKRQIYNLFLKLNNKLSEINVGFIKLILSRFLIKDQRWIIKKNYKECL